MAYTIVLIYGIFTLVGGVIGFLKAKSKASLIAGGIFGILLLICANGIKNGNLDSYIVAGLISLVLGIRFFKTWLAKRKLMPDLLMVVFSVLSLIIIIVEIIR